MKIEISQSEINAIIAEQVDSKLNVSLKSDEILVKFSIPIVGTIQLGLLPVAASGEKITLKVTRPLNKIGSLLKFFKNALKNIPIDLSVLTEKDKTFTIDLNDFLKNKVSISLSKITVQDSKLLLEGVIG